jgi:hypothetical protein
MSKWTMVSRWQCEVRGGNPVQLSLTVGKVCVLGSDPTGWKASGYAMPITARNTSSSRQYVSSPKVLRFELTDTNASSIYGSCQRFVLNAALDLHQLYLLQEATN